MKSLWRLNVDPRATHLGYAAWIGAIILLFTIKSVSLGLIVKIILLFIIGGIWGICIHVANRMTMDYIKTSIPYDLSLAVEVSNKRPDLRKLCKSLNPQLTDEMIDKTKDDKRPTGVKVVFKK